MTHPTKAPDPLTPEDIANIEAMMPHHRADWMSRNGDLVLAALRATTPDPAEHGLRCAKCHGTDISTRWDRSHFDCLYREQQRGDWPRDGGEHLHHGCRTCFYSWAAALARSEDPS